MPKQTALDPRILVLCDETGEPTAARLHGGKYFCACCGSTEHTAL